MRKLVGVLVALFCTSLTVNAQLTFPQQAMNTATRNGFEQSITTRATNAQAIPNESSHLMPVLRQLDALKKNSTSFLERHDNSQQTLALDTIIVGLIPNDTLRITGNWTHTGPIYVFNDGVLIFDQANVIDTGDVYVFGQGQLWADSSSFFFPQAFFYERGLLILQNAYARFSNCSFNYSGMSHTLVVAGAAQLDWENIHQNDWTTCGLYGSPILNIHGCNLSGEYILSDTATTNFVHADSIILWHQLPNTALINYSFPPGALVYNYQFNNTTVGVSGVNYNVTADSCATVWWALMPSNGSDVTISNSAVRLIGCWFEHNDTANVHGIFNNSTYTNSTLPLTDRNLHLINTTVETWSMYVFDSSSVSIDSCQLGEVGSQQMASITGTNFILDGTGGYYWATDSSFVIGSNVICYSTCRSERKGLFLLAYSTLPFLPPTAIYDSYMICVQNTLAFDPIPYNGSVAWLAKMDAPDTASVNATFPITGSAWINQGPDGNAMDFGSYSLYYQNPNQSATWFPIVVNVTSEVSHSTLANWNTTGLQPGTYILKQVLIDNFNDSVEGFKIIELLPNPVGIAAVENEFSVTLFPNPSSGLVWVECAVGRGQIAVFNAFGESVFKTSITEKRTLLNLTNASGIYFWTFTDETGKQQTGKLILR